MQVMNYNITAFLPDISNEEQIIINTINPHSYCVAKKDMIFREALQQADYLLPDGIGIVYGTKVLTGEKIKRITGSDLHLYLLNEAQKRGLKIFYLGASPETLKKITSKLKSEYSSLQVSSHSPPYKSVFSEEDNLRMIEAVNNFSPDILFVGMTAPKQEKWVFENKEFINARILCSIGAVFDFYAGTVKRPGLFWQRLGLEWMPRLLREPKRMFNRNFYTTPQFVIDVIKYRLKKII